MSNFKKGDFVFAKIRGYSPWPALINSSEEKGKNVIYGVKFFGTRETGSCKAADLAHYRENKNKLSQGKMSKNEKFILALKEIETEIKKSNIGKVRSNSDTPNSKSQTLQFSTPVQSEIIELEVSQANATQDKNEFSFCETGVNTEIDLDLNFQLAAITERCIELEKTVMEQNESSISKTLSKSLEQEKILPCHCKFDFQTQILLDELNKYKLEVHNLKTVVEILQKDKCELGEQLKAKNQNELACIHCFPPVDFEKPSTSLESSWQKPKSTLKSQDKPSYFQIECQNSFGALLQEAESEICPDENVVYASPLNKGNLTRIKNKSRVVVEPNKEDSVEPVATNCQQKEVCAIEKTLICADSHGKDLVWNLNQYSQVSSNMYAFITPGGKSKQILQAEKIIKEISTEKDSLVIMCGTNDVARNEAEEAVNSIRATLDQVKRNKVFLIDIPHRHDLVHWSCVNNEIQKTNSILKDLSQNYKNVTLIEASQAERHHHTRHGMHLNTRGKKWLAGQIIKAMQGGKSSSELLSAQTVHSEDSASTSNNCSSLTTSVTVSNKTCTEVVDMHGDKLLLSGTDRDLLQNSQMAVESSKPSQPEPTTVSQQPGELPNQSEPTTVCQQSEELHAPGTVTFPPGNDQSEVESVAT